VPPYYETRAYVARVVKDFNKKKAAQKSSIAKRATKQAPSAKDSSTGVIQAKAAGASN
jgi:hypothetical protein